MAKCKVKPDTATFHFYNLNPKGRSTGDCVIRAVAAFLGMTWEATYRELAEWGIKNGTAIGCPENYAAFLHSKGFEKQPMPRRENRTRYTAKDFCMELADADSVYILSLAGHLTYIEDQRIFDTWNCGGKCVGNIWVRKSLTK